MQERYTIKDYDQAMCKALPEAIDSLSRMPLNYLTTARSTDGRVILRRLGLTETDLLYDYIMAIDNLFCKACYDELIEALQLITMMPLDMLNDTSPQFRSNIMRVYTDEYNIVGRMKIGVFLDVLYRVTNNHMIDVINNTILYSFKTTHKIQTVEDLLLLANDAFAGINHIDKKMIAIITYLSFIYPITSVITRNRNTNSIIVRNFVYKLIREGCFSRAVVPDNTVTIKAISTYKNLK